MDKRIQIAAIVGAVMFSILVLTSPDDPIPIPEPNSEFESDSVSIIAENLDNPRAIAIHDDRVFITEKGGLIRVVQNNTLLDAPLAVLRAPNAFNAGLLGIALHPNFAENHFIYVLLTYEEDGSLWNRILRITESENRLRDATTIIEGIPGSAFTNGGFVKFGPDDKLYIGTGTPYEASHLPQDPDSLAGKILRINDDGSIPEDNPFTDSSVYSLGFRDPQGMAWDDAGQMFVVDIGPEKNDEINLIIPGANYGWPEQECVDRPGFKGAILCYDPSIEPGGIIFYSGSLIDLEHEFLMTSLQSSNLYQLDLDEGLGSQKSILSGIGRIRDVAQGADGSIYVITSNTDGKGFPSGSDDKLLRVIR